MADTTIAWWCELEDQCPEIAGHGCAKCYPGPADVDIPLLEKARWDRRLRNELHSLTRYPPIAVDDEAADRLAADGLIRRQRPGEGHHPVDLALRGLGADYPDRPGGTRRFVLTETGRQRLRQTESLCRVPHCPCHGGSKTK